MKVRQTETAFGLAARSILPKMREARKSLHVYMKKEWKEVLPKRDVTGDITNICDIKYHFSNDSGNCYEFSFIINKSDKRFAPKLEGRKAQAVVLPEGMNWKEWIDTYYLHGPNNLVGSLSKNTTTVIQVWQEGE